MVHESTGVLLSMTTAENLVIPTDAASLDPSSQQSKPDPGWLSESGAFIKMVLPETVILIGLWSPPPRGGAKVIRKITESSVGGIYASMEQAVRGITSLVSTASEETIRWVGR
jgi:hypothetical protein